MENTYFENNKVYIAGEVDSELTFSHMIYGERFYLFRLKVPRLSENFDLINITISERFFPYLHPQLGDMVEIHGQFRSYNNFSETGSRLILTVFVKSIDYITDAENLQNPNRIFLNGFICKQPVYRTTPFKREIADILLAVNRPYGKSDYIPCICWGRNARFASGFEVGGHTQIWGRIQSREYMKKLSEEESEKRIAYEISVSKLEYLES